MKQTTQAGFTLLELMLSIAIISVLTGLSLPLYESFLRRNDLDLTVQSAASLVRRAEVYARGNSGDSVWGVAFQSSGITLYKGASYATRAAAFDETVAMPGSVNVSGLSEVTFAKLTAMPSASGTVTFAGTTNDARSLTINAKGMVDY